MRKELTFNNRRNNYIIDKYYFQKDRKYLCWSLFLIKFVKKKLQHRCFPVNIARFFLIASIL